jgi:flagellar protein FlaG
VQPQSGLHALKPKQDKEDRGVHARRGLGLRTTEVGHMTNLNKLAVLGATTVAPVAQVQPGTAAVSAERQALADSGKFLPGAQHEQEAEDRLEELHNAVRNVSGYVQNITRQLNFSIDEQLGETVVRVIDENTGDVIRQIPSEDMLQLSKNLAEIKERQAKGLLFQGDA